VWGESFFFLVILHVEVWRIMIILPDRAFGQRSCHLSPHLAGAVDNGGVNLSVSFRQVAMFLYRMQQIYMRLVTKHNQTIVNVSQAASFWLHVILFFTHISITLTAQSYLKPVA